MILALAVFAIFVACMCLHVRCITDRALLALKQSNVGKSDG